MITDSVSPATLRAVAEELATVSMTHQFSAWGGAVVREGLSHAARRLVDRASGLESQAAQDKQDALRHIASSLPERPADENVRPWCEACHDKGDKPCENCGRGPSERHSLHASKIAGSWGDATVDFKYNDRMREAMQPMRGGLFQPPLRIRDLKPGERGRLECGCVVEPDGRGSWALVSEPEKHPGECPRFPKTDAYIMGTSVTRLDPESVSVPKAEWEALKKLEALVRLGPNSDYVDLTPNFAGWCGNLMKLLASITEARRK